MAGEIQLNSTTFATESGGTITIDNVDSATNRQNLGLEIGVDVQAFDADTTKNDVANTFSANQIISVTDNTNAALRVTQLGTGNALVVEDSANPDSTPFVVDSSGNVGIKTSSPNAALDVSGFFTCNKTQYIVRGSLSSSTVTPLTTANEFSYLVNTFSFTGTNSATGPGMYLVGRKGTANSVKTIVSDTSVSVSINGSDQIEITSTAFTSYNIQVASATF